MKKRTSHKRSGKWLLYIAAIFVLGWIIISVRACMRTDHARDGFHTSGSSGNGLMPEAPGQYIPVNDTTGLPAKNDSLQQVHHFAYTLGYSEQHEQAAWVAWMLTPARMHGRTKRSNDFREDPAVTTGSARLDDYYNSGYDRGHIVPAADMKWSDRAMSETFLLSNISPQNHTFNSTIWNDLEQQVRKWAAHDSLLIVSGPVLRDIKKRIGKSRVSVPAAYYKVILDVQGPQLKAIAFVIPNQAVAGGFWNYSTTIDAVEELTGLDFFPALEDGIENQLEAEANRAVWH